MLVAIAIPVFNAQLEKSRDATTISNLRAAYAEAVSAYLGGTADDSANINISGDDVTVLGVVIKGRNESSSWSTAELPFTVDTTLGAKGGTLDKGNTTINCVFTYDSTTDKWNMKQGS